MREEMKQVKCGEEWGHGREEGLSDLGCNERIHAKVDDDVTDVKME